MKILAHLAVACGIFAAPLVAQVPFWDHFQATAGPRAVDRAAQVRAESGFNPKAQSFVMKNGQKVPCAQGLAQFTPPTWLAWGQGGDPWNPQDAIRAQHAYMLYLEGRCGGDWAAALGSYNAGLGSVRKAQRLAGTMGLEGPRAWIRALPRVTGFNPLTQKPHAEETRLYIERIEAIHVPWVRRKAGK